MHTAATNCNAQLELQYLAGMGGWGGGLYIDYSSNYIAPINFSLDEMSVTCLTEKGEMETTEHPAALLKMRGAYRSASPLSQGTLQPTPGPLQNLLQHY